MAETTDARRDRAMARAYTAGASLRQVADEFGVSASTVQRALRRTATTPRPPGRSRQADDATILARHQAGWIQAEIADALGIHPITVRRVFRRHGIDGREQAARRRRRVDRDQARDLLVRVGNQSEVGRQLGVSHQTIHRIAHGG